MGGLQELVTDSDRNMPFKSKKQFRWMWKNKPELAKEWTKKYGSLQKKFKPLKEK